jgi:AraC-like DNA-binding protein
MSAESGLCRFTAERVHLPRLASSATFYWDGRGALSRDLGSPMDSEPGLPELPVTRSVTQASASIAGHTAMGRHARPSLPAEDRCRVPSSPPWAIDWTREAHRLTFCLDPRLLMPAARDVIASATGELLWACREAHDQSIILYVHPVLLVPAAATSRQGDRVEIVPDFHAGDPLLHHIALVLQAAIDAEDVAGRLYAEALTHALAVHLLRRCETCRPPAEASPGRLSTPKLRRTTEYIEAHLAHELSVAELAAVVQTSPDHFARLFRHATGQTPHHYVIMCRIARAKRLLRETEWPIIEISHQVGFTDQSYFTAVFRKHVATTPKAYRVDTQR